MSQGRRGEYRSRPGRVSDYMYIDEEKELPVDAWAAKRRSEGMYHYGSTLPGARGNRQNVPYF